MLPSKNGISEEERYKAAYQYRLYLHKKILIIFLNNVIPKLRNPDILYKLIWSEYIQKNTNEMLITFFPIVCGIYKMTLALVLLLKESLTIKSSVGISTILISIHKAMRSLEFYLLIECAE